MINDAEYLVNFKNYYIYSDFLLKNEKPKVYVPDITLNNIDDHTVGIMNILKDGIGSEYVNNMRINISWENNINCDLTIVDYWFNLFMWSMLLKTNTPIRPKHIFYDDNLLRKHIKKYIDKFIITINNEINTGIHDLNEYIATAVWNYSYTEYFAFYLANTINNEDDIDLMNASKEFYDALHLHLYGKVPIEEVKDEGMKYAYQAIDIIKNSKNLIGYEHGLTNSFRSGEATNPRQYKETSIHIGTKPDGSGGAHPYIIDTNFKTGGVNTPASYFIESSAARLAQIYSKNNVGETGDFARLLGLNNTDTILNKDPNFRCMSQHFIKFEIKSEEHLKRIKHRCYRFNPNGIDYYIDQYDKSLIGKTIYMHSPMTCSSNSSGHGICIKCYGNLYYINRNINVGKIAAENMSAPLTQKLLSAKHLLETVISSLNWNSEFNDWFEVDINNIRLSDSLDEFDIKKWTMVINPEDVQLVNEEEDTVNFDDEEQEYESFGRYNEYILSFTLKSPDGNEIEFTTEEQSELYLSNELNAIIRKKASNTDGKVNIPLSTLIGSPLFYIKIENDEISKTMNSIINIINKASVTEVLSKDEIVQNIVDLCIYGDLDIDAIHLEVILSNQMRDAHDPLSKPNWNMSNAEYKMLTLDHALTNNPSVIVSLLYKDLHKVLYNPLTFNKHAPSFFDLFFCEQPQVYMNDDLYIEKNELIKDLEGKVLMYEVKENDDREQKFLQKLEKNM